MSGMLEKFTPAASVGLFPNAKAFIWAHKSHPESRRATIQSVMITLRIYRDNTQMALHIGADLWPAAHVFWAEGDANPLTSSAQGPPTRHLSGDCRAEGDSCHTYEKENVRMLACGMWKCTKGSLTCLTACGVCGSEPRWGYDSKHSMGPPLVPNTSWKCLVTFHKSPTSALVQASYSSYHGSK